VRLNSATVICEQRVRGKAIVGHNKKPGSSGRALLSLVFADGGRPDADCLTEFSAQCKGLNGGSGPGFAVSHRPDNDEGWLELLSMGLTLDCRGLAPADAMPPPPQGQLFGLSEPVTGEAIELALGPHMGKGRPLMPVIKVMCGLGATLATLTGVQAVCWGPAKSWMAPDYFIRTITSWLTGGAFPSLGLVSLERDSGGALATHGLDYLIGQELRFEPDRRMPLAAATRIAVRLIHQMAEGGAIHAATDLTGPLGEALLATPLHEGQQLRVIGRP
jgi:hypothetical protein